MSDGITSTRKIIVNCEWRSELTEIKVDEEDKEDENKLDKKKKRQGWSCQIEQQRKTQRLTATVIRVMSH